MGMFELGYKPCQLDNFVGRYLHGEARKCNSFKQTIDKQSTKDK